MDTIEGMRTFAAVAAKQSFTAGAKRLGISTKLASKYVRQLEERLGAQLFHRTTRSVTLTQTGHAYFERCRPLLDQFDELEGLVQERQSELAGMIRMTAPTGFGSTHLVHALQPFQHANPNVHVDLHLSDHHVAVIEEGFDIAIRFGKLKDSTLVAKKLLDMRVICCVSPAYINAHGEPSKPADLVHHNCLLQTTSTQSDHWAFQTKGHMNSVPISGNFRANSPMAVANMAASGAGVGRVPKYIAQPYIDDGRLVVLFEDSEIDPIQLFAVYPPGRHLTARIRAVIDHLNTALN